MLITDISDKLIYQDHFQSARKELRTAHLKIKKRGCSYRLDSLIV